MLGLLAALTVPTAQRRSGLSGRISNGVVAQIGERVSIPTRAFRRRCKTSGTTALPGRVRRGGFKEESIRLAPLGPDTRERTARHGRPRLVSPACIDQRLVGALHGFPAP